MSQILIAYASREGQTEKIARHIASRLTQSGHEPVVINLKDGGREDAADHCSAAIIAGSVHLARHDQSLSGFIMRHGPTLRSVPSAFLCVSLSAASKDAHDLTAVDEITKSFLYEAGWHPDFVEHVAGAVRDSRLGLFDRFTVHAVMMEKEIPSDASGDTELTNWEKLDGFIGEFAQLVAVRRQQE